MLKQKKRDKASDADFFALWRELTGRDLLKEVETEKRPVSKD